MRHIGEARKTPTKRCSRCDKEYPLTEFYSYIKNGYLSYTSMCKQCKAEYAHEQMIKLHNNSGALAKKFAVGDRVKFLDPNSARGNKVVKGRVVEIYPHCITVEDNQGFKHGFNRKSAALDLTEVR